jgi:hypothetical protein
VRSKAERFRSRFVISLIIGTSNGPVVVERWSDNALPSDTPVVGNAVDMPVRIQHYTTARGSGVRLVWGQDDSGDQF